MEKRFQETVCGDEPELEQTPPTCPQNDIPRFDCYRVQYRSFLCHSQNTVSVYIRIYIYIYVYMCVCVCLYLGIKGTVLLSGSKILALLWCLLKCMPLTWGLRRPLQWGGLLSKFVTRPTVFFILERPGSLTAEREGLTWAFLSCRFSEPTFRPSGATKHWKNTVNRDFSTFSRACIFFLLTVFLLWSSSFSLSLLWLFPPVLFHLFILLEVWLLNFKLPSMIIKCVCLYIYTIYSIIYSPNSGPY